MNPAVIENDTNPTYDPEVLPSAPINPPPDLNDPAVLVKLGKEYAHGMMMESEAASGIGNQCGSSNPAFLFAQVAKVLLALTRKVEATLTPPAKSDAASPAEAPKTEAPKTGKK